MPTTNYLNTLRILLIVLCLALCVFYGSARGEGTEDTLDLFNGWQDQSSTASRAPKPLSQTAENVTVITRPEIEALNAHTLADVLDTVPGIQAEHIGSVGNLVQTHIQSSSVQHVLVLVDGFPINTGDNFSDVSLVPAQIIERIEIVKGAASSSWGQALGGVINVITKSPDPERTIGGSVTASLGERTTADTRAEVSGTAGRLGYYLSGGYLGTDGFTPHSAASSNGLYTKLTWNLPDRGQIWSTFKYDRADRGTLWYPAWDTKEDKSFHYLDATLGMRKQLTSQLELELLGHHAFRKYFTTDNNITDNAIQYIINGWEQASGGSAKLVWRGSDNLLVAGGDYEHFELNNSYAYVPVDTLARIVDRWGVYLNDTATFGPVSVSPGVRFDRTVSNGDQFSASLGAVWRITDTTMARAYTARGYSLPSLTLDLPSEKVWTTQIGFESTAVPYLWLKCTLFRNELWDVQSDPGSNRHVALGSELEARTVPVFNTSLAAGWTYTDTYRTSNGSHVNLPAATQTVQLALRYDDHTYRGVLTGRHIWWDSNVEPDFNGRYYGLVWDLHLGATLLKRENSSLELFFSGHNLFNNSQYWVDAYPNTGRWFEGGMKVRF